MQEKRQAILTGPLSKTIIRLTIPSIVGMLGLMIFNVVDTYFVGRLGALELAAISFTFPVVMVINSLVFGIGVGSMTLFSRAVGNQNREEEKLLATSSLILGISLAALLGLIGHVTIEPVFRLLGAGEELMPYIKSYMRIWYAGTAFMVIPMLSDSILRGLGDTFTPAFVMLTVAVVNAVMDPILIFGIGPFPEMGIAGAAVATLLSRAIATIVSFLIQIFREKLITFRGLTPGKVWKTWKALFHIGLPNSAIKAILPLGTAIFTSILAGYGHEAVAGFGVAAKIEGVVLALFSALAVTAAVFVGQNLGAQNYDRAQKGIRRMRQFSHIGGILAALILFFTGRYLAGFFNDDPTVRHTAAAYLMIVPIGYGLYGCGQVAASVLNVYHKPFLAGGLSLFQIGVVAVPLAYLLPGLLGLNGVFLAILISFIALGVLSFFAVKRESKKILPPTESI
ncbi:MAG: MATE family efflux transporter [Spirochaetales bacterium]|nr:MATE family efflux transporter [Spirochaetales bacterium]